MDWLCVACSLAASNPSDGVPAAESMRTVYVCINTCLNLRNVTILLSSHVMSLEHLL